MTTEIDDSDLIDDKVYAEPPVPNYTQAIEFVAAANELGRALGWRRPNSEEAELMNDAFEACMRKNSSTTSSITGML
jgi:hypothetical protein